ncbi:hypothetical protein TNCV_752501 [Trichonephila clavipes]|uniref:Uncharacterized protein n=1 Tax=Trichonephila clavipes TaxID=2585209 RepID=A0A8X6WBC0_TRICX|nr:hypothetical protein TNCV_752501 [Trichonephila clavipes]
MNQATMTYPLLSKGYVEVSVDVNSVMTGSSVMLVLHGAVQRRRNVCCVWNFGQDLLQEDQICSTIQSTEEDKEFHAAPLSCLLNHFWS